MATYIVACGILIPIMKKRTAGISLALTVTLLLGGAAFDISTTPPAAAAEREQAAAHLTRTNKTAPAQPFHHDGCSLFPDRIPGHDLRDACLKHDILYWAGGSVAERKAADVAFRDEIAHTGVFGPAIAWIAYSGVRLFGDSAVARSLDAEWGYGHD